MGKLVESTFMTLDGVIGEPQNWSGPYWDDEHSAYASKLLFGADALLLGRKTYDGFAAAWPQRSGDDYTDRINAMPKYVASTTLTEPTWNANVLGSDVAADVARLKDDENLSLLKFGSGEVDKVLFGAGLVDELHVWTFPVVAGEGDRLLAGLDLRHFELADMSRFGSGIVVLVYTPKSS